MNVGSLFSGIGGLDLGLERAGMTVKWQSEIDPFCCEVLAKHWPGVPNLGDVTNIEWEGVERVDLICGGYPCQPFSLAGARAGADDERHLWPFFRDAIGVLRPDYALLENVPGHISLGLDTVLADLTELGYDAEWDLVPAAAVGAPHLRYRLFVIAYAMRGRRKSDPFPTGWRAAEPQECGSEMADTNDARLEGREPAGRRDLPTGSGPRGDVPDSDRLELRHQPGWRDGQDRPGAVFARDDGAPRDVADTDGERLEGAELQRERNGLISKCSDDSGTRNRNHWAVEPNVGRVAYGVPRRVDRLRALGNAVVPQVAEYVGRRILAAR